MSEMGPSVIFWFMVSVLATVTGVGGMIGLLPLYRKFNGYIAFISVVSIYAKYGLLLYFFFIRHSVPQKCLGSHGKLMVDAIAMSSAMALRQFLEFNVFSLFALVGFTADLHAFAQSLHIAYDVSIWDILFGSIMQIVVYMVCENKYMLSVAFVLCGGVSFYRYTSYSPPVIPIDAIDAKELEKQLC